MGRLLSAVTSYVIAVVVISVFHLEQNFVHGIPVPIPRPQVSPGRIPPHIATHPALSSVTNGKETALLQYAYNTQNRRGQSPSNLVLQNQQGQQNLNLVNQLQTLRAGQTGGNGVPLGQLGGGSNGLPYSQDVHGHSHGNENPSQKAFELLQQYKGQGQQPNNNNYNPVPLTPHQHSHGATGHQHHYPPPGAVGHGHPSPVPDLGREDEREDIRRLKSLLNLPPGPSQGPPPNSFGNASPTIGVIGQRGVITPPQHGHQHGHQHPHPQQPFQGPTPTPFPSTAQSQHSLGNLPYSQSPRPYIYSGAGGPTATPALNIPYRPGQTQYAQPGHAHEHGHDHHHHGQDARTLIQSVESPPESYQPLVYIDPIRDPNSINKHIEQSQSVFILPASDFTSDDFQRLLNRPAEILIDVVPTNGSQQGSDFSLHNFSLLLTPSTYARCAQASHKQGYGGKCKLILKVGKKSGLFGGARQPVQVSYK